MILATIELPNGTHLHLDGNGRWSGDDDLIVAYANDYPLAPTHRPNWAASVAKEIASKIGGKVVFAIPKRDSAPPGALY